MPAATATHTAAPEAANAWKGPITEQLQQLNPGPDLTHAVILIPEQGDAQLLDVRESEASAAVSAADRAEKVDSGEISVVTIASLIGDGGPELVPIGKKAAGTTSGENADTGKLFDIKIDLSKPSKIGLSFSGDINLTDREDPRWSQLYNDLEHGKSRTVTVTLYTKGATKTHRRDKDGNVDAVVETKSILVTDIHLTT